MNEIFTDSQDSQDEAEEFQINSKYAEKFLKTKKLEEVSSLKRKYEGNVDDYSISSSSEEDEDETGELLTKEVDLEIENTLNLLKSKDSRIYDSKINFFSPETLAISQEKKEKPFTIKDYHRRELLKENSESMIVPVKDSVMASALELNKEIKMAFKEAVKEDSENLFTIKKDAKDCTKVKSSAVCDEDFLSEYLNKKKWMQVEDNSSNLLLEEEEEEEERGIEAMEEFEQKYNFRFEEQGADTLMTHAREVKSSLRRKDDKRRRMREKKLQRMDEEKIRKQEELKRLKNLKKEEIMERLSKIEKVSGTKVEDLQEFLSRDFDPKDFDSHMQEKFGNDYYSQKDKKFKQEQDLETLKDFKDFDLEQDAENIPLLKENLEQQKESLLDDLYALDYEDLIGDLPVRFKYRNVDANNYGIKAKEILVADDKDLNEFLSLKKLAPYRSAEKRKKDTKSWYKHGKSKVKEFKASLKKTKTKKSDSQAEIDPRLASYNL